MNAKPKNTYWFDGRQIDESEAFDSNGVMRDGVGLRVGTMMRDGVEVAEGIMMFDQPVPLGYQVVTDSNGRTLVDAFNEPLSPHYGRKGYTFIDADRSIREQNHQLRKAELSARCKGGLQLGDEVIIDGERMKVCGNSREGDKPILSDASTVDGSEMKRAATGCNLTIGLIADTMREFDWLARTFSVRLSPAEKLEQRLRVQLTILQKTVFLRYARARSGHG